MSPLVDAALDLEEEERAQFLLALSREDSVAAADLAALLAESTVPHPLLDEPAGARFAALISDAFEDRDDTALRTRLQASLGERCTLEQELPGGGMSRVFLASEPALARRIVVKVVAPELLSPRTAQRFEREIRLSASLQQANILPLLWTGTGDGLSYYAMPFIEGRSLRERLARDGRLPVAEAVGVLRDVARALAYAHERGVVHRDIKPGNVLLSAGTAVVTDFGIAKALGTAMAREDAGDMTEGVVLGTPGYMAPEQASNDPSVDHRADIYAFGCLAYAVFTGHPPFHAGAAHKVISAHFRDTPPPISDRRPEVPARIAALVARCLEKDPSQRPQQATELLEGLEAGAAELDGSTVRRAAGRMSRSVTRGMARHPVLASAAIIVAGIIGVYGIRNLPGLDAWRDDPPPLTLAVVPFSTAPGERAGEYLGEGMADEILTTMDKVPGLQLEGRATAYRFRGPTRASSREVQRALGVRFLVTGTLRSAGGRLLVTAQLEDSSAHTRLWAMSYDRDEREFSSVSNDIVRAVTKALGVHRGRIQRAPPPRADALDLYLAGQALLRRRGPGVADAAAYFERAIALDSRFARAYASLATALTLFPYFLGSEPAEVRDRAANAARRALSLDSTLSEAYVALATMHAHDGRWPEAIANYRRALVLAPDDVNALLTYGRILIHLGRPAEAMPLLQRAHGLERMSSLLSGWISYASFLQGDERAALAESARAVQLDSVLLPTVNLASLINLAAGRGAVARGLIGATPPRVSLMTNAPYVYARLGEVARAEQLVADMRRNTPQPWFTEVASATVGLATGDTSRALDELERASKRVGAAWIIYLPLADPAYDPVRATPRFAALVRSARMDAAFLQPRGGRRELYK